MAVPASPANSSDRAVSQQRHDRTPAAPLDPPPLARNCSHWIVVVGDSGKMRAAALLLWMSALLFVHATSHGQTVQHQQHAVIKHHLQLQHSAVLADSPVRQSHFLASLITSAYSQEFHCISIKFFWISLSSRGIVMFSLGLLVCLLGFNGFQWVSSSVFGLARLWPDRVLIDFTKIWLVFKQVPCSKLCHCDGNSVDCSNRGLGHVPLDLPKDADKMWVHLLPSLT